MQGQGTSLPAGKAGDEERTRDEERDKGPGRLKKK